MSVKTEPSKYLKFLLMLSRLDRALGTSLALEFSEVLSEERQLVREAFGQNQTPPPPPLPNPWYGNLGVEEEKEDEDQEVKVVEAPEPTIHLVNLVDHDSEGSSQSSWVQAEVVAEDPSSPPSVGSEPISPPPIFRKDWDGPEGKLILEDPPTPVARKIVKPSRKVSTSLRRGTRSRRAPERLIDQD